MPSVLDLPSSKCIVGQTQALKSLINNKHDACIEWFLKAFTHLEQQIPVSIYFNESLAIYYGEQPQKN